MIDQPSESQALLCSSGGPLGNYRALLAKGRLRQDANQKRAAEKLQSLFTALQSYEPGAGPVGWRERLTLRRCRQNPPPQGLYIYGGVGTGKSMIMDIFYETVPVRAKRRVHFHGFMEEVQQRLHNKRGLGQEDPLLEVADDLMREAWLLCFDEFHVVNIADAMILARLFKAFFDRGMVVVSTSNWPPCRLYEGGLQRQNFLPFIDLLNQKMDVLELDNGVDYRRDRMRSRLVYFYPLNPESCNAVEDVFKNFAGDHPIEKLEIKILGHSVFVPRAAGPVAQFGFDDICGQPLGVSDYMALARRFPCLIVANVPLLASEQRNEARRFMLLVDALYERRCKLVISAEGPPEQLYPTGQSAYEFERTVSRLHEMGSQDYSEQPHISC